MPSRFRRRCVDCGKHDSEVGPISWSGLCSEDAKRRFEENLDGLHYHAGPYFTHWRRRSAAALGALLVDDILRED